MFVIAKRTRNCSTWKLTRKVCDLEPLESILALGSLASVGNTGERNLMSDPKPNQRYPDDMWDGKAEQLAKKRILLHNDDRLPELAVVQLRNG